jgi:RHS repeat-associated protein
VEYWEYSYNLRNQLTKVTKNGQLVATYAYDGLGLRVSATTTITSKTTGQAKTTTRNYLFDLADRVIYDRVISTASSLPSAEDPETSTKNSYIFAGGTHFAKVEGPIGTTAEVYYYHNDHLGSPMAITDSQGNLAWSQDYLPYGEALNENATQTKTRFTFTGKELDPATGLMYYNARWYDPDLGRFMTEDTYPGDPNQPQKLNRYIYVMGNPLRFTDPTGHDAGFAGRDPNELSERDMKRKFLEERTQEARERMQREQRQQTAKGRQYQIRLKLARDRLYTGHFSWQSRGDDFWRYHRDRRACGRGSCRG